MRITFVAEVERQKAIQIQRIPWILDWYRRPFDRWPSSGRQALFGAPIFLLYLLYQKACPFTAKGTFLYRTKGQEKTIRFNSKNTQFRALYLEQFKDGYEPLTTALINLIVPPEATFYDIGSNWGWFSLSLAARPNFVGKIHAFEPFPPSFADLTSVVSQAGMQDRIQCHHMALSDHRGKGAMHMPDLISSGLASLEEDQSAPSGAGTEIATLDSLTLNPPSVMKVDVEGAEAKVFRGGANLLAKHKPMIVFESFRFYGDVVNTLEPMAVLNSMDYVFFRMGWWKKTPKMSYFTGDEGDADARPKETLVLAEFPFGERFLLPDGLNILACHRDRVADLGKHFQKI